MELQDRIQSALADSSLENVAVVETSDNIVASIYPRAQYGFLPARN